MTSFSNLQKDTDRNIQIIMVQSLLANISTLNLAISQSNLHFSIYQAMGIAEYWIGDYWVVQLF